MNLQKIDEHTFDVSLLGPETVALDIGCRNFTISRALASLGCRVYALDPDPTIQPPQIKNVTFIRRALVGPALLNPEKVIPYSIWGNGTGNYVGTSFAQPSPEKIVPVMATSIEQLSAELDVDLWDAVKLDCEGSEYQILMSWPGPIARQVTVEFHEHTRANPNMMNPEVTYELIKSRMGRWYDLVQHNRGYQHGLSEPNYWDSLFRLKNA